MLHPWFRIVGLGLAVAALVACGGGGGGPSTMPPDDGGDDGGDGDGGDGGGGGPVSPFTAPSETQALYFVNDLPGEFAIVRANHNAGGFTPLTSLPDMGIVAYDGFMEINIASTPSAAIQSAATLTIDMGTGMMGGGANEFMGWAYNAETDSSELALYEGDVSFSGGSLTADVSGNTRISVQVDGALNNGLQDFALTGTLDGRMYGAQGEGLYAGGSYYGLGRDITLTADGVDVYGDVNIWATK